MNDIIASLMERKSTRIFTEEPVTEDEKRAILLAACAAPTAGNQQLYTILDITDQDLKDRLAVTCDDQSFIAQAPLVLIFAADAQKWYDAYRLVGAEPREPGAGDILLAVIDATIAAQNAVVAAESLGIGSCYIGDIMELVETHRELLNLPDYVLPACMVVFGRPTEQQLKRRKPQRSDLTHIVHENCYYPMNEAELRELFSNHPGERAFDDWMRAFCQRKYNSDFAREMSRSVQVYLDGFMRY